MNFDHYGYSHSPVADWERDLQDASNGIADVRFHFRDGSSHVIKRVKFDTVGGDPNGHKSDTTGDFANGNLFHVPNVVWWEVV